MITVLIPRLLNLFMPIFKTVLLCVFSVVLLGACERPFSKLSSGLPIPQQTFAHVKPLTLAVSNVEVVQSEASLPAPEGFVLSLPALSQTYLSRKLQPIGQGGQGRVLRAIVEQNTVAYIQRGSEFPILKKIGVDQVDNYTMALVIRLEALDAQGRIVLGQVMRAHKSFGVSEHDSLADRERAQLEAVESLFAMVDSKIEQIVLNEMRL